MDVGLSEFHLVCVCVCVCFGKYSSCVFPFLSVPFLYVCTDQFLQTPMKSVSLYFK